MKIVMLWVFWNLSPVGTPGTTGRNPLHYTEKSSVGDTPLLLKVSHTNFKGLSFYTLKGLFVFLPLLKIHNYCTLSFVLFMCRLPGLKRRWCGDIWAFEWREPGVWNQKQTTRFRVPIFGEIYLLKCWPKKLPLCVFKVMSWLAMVSLLWYLDHRSLIV